MTGIGERVQAVRQLISQRRAGGATEAERELREGLSAPRRERKQTSDVGSTSRSTAAAAAMAAWAEPASR